jgi:hypothetical protein
MNRRTQSSSPDSSGDGARRLSRLLEALHLVIAVLLILLLIMSLIKLADHPHTACELYSEEVIAHLVFKAATWVRGQLI